MSGADNVKIVLDKTRTGATVNYGRAAQPARPPGDHALPAGTEIAEFRIIRLLGEGGFGIVYLAWDNELEREVALKEYFPQALATRVGDAQVAAKSVRQEETFAAGLKCFIKEARLLAKFNHQSLVNVHRFWEANGTAYMVMPFYEGVTLKEALQRMDEPPPELWLRNLLAPLLGVLSVLHRAHCYHRDVAPDNIILLDGGGRPVLLDFGAARRVIADMSQPLTVILKPGYAPPEQYGSVTSWKQGPWTDLYALAGVIHYAIKGTSPPAAVERLMVDNYVPLANSSANRYSDAFLRAIDHGLAVAPEDRPQSVDAFAHELGLDMIERVHHDPAPRPQRDTSAIKTTPVDSSRNSPTQAGYRTRGSEPPTLVATAPNLRPIASPTGYAVFALALAAFAGVGIWLFTTHTVTLDVPMVNPPAMRPQPDTGASMVRATPSSNGASSAMPTAADPPSVQGASVAPGKTVSPVASAETAAPAVASMAQPLPSGSPSATHVTSVTAGQTSRPDPPAVSGGTAARAASVPQPLYSNKTAPHVAATSSQAALQTAPTITATAAAIEVGRISCRIVGNDFNEINVRGTASGPRNATFLFVTSVQNSKPGLGWNLACPDWTTVDNGHDLLRATCIHRPSDNSVTDWGITGLVKGTGPFEVFFVLKTQNEGRVLRYEKRQVPCTSWAR